MPTPFDQQIDELQEKIAKLESERQRFLSMSPDNQDADRLRKACCTYNHDDQCGWYWETWEKPGVARERWVAISKELKSNGFSVDQAIAIYNIIKRM